MQSLFHPALLMLIRLQWKGAFRQFRQSLKTARGLFHVGFVVALILYGIGSMVFVGMFASGSTSVFSTLDKMQNDFIALGLFGLTSCLVLFTTGEASVFFTASEVAFLFPAPLTRRQLLTFKLLKSLLGILAVSVMFSLFSLSKIGLVLPRMIGTLLTLSFLQLLTMDVAFIRRVLQEKLHLLIRCVLGLVIGVLVLLAVSQMNLSKPEADLGEHLKAFQQSTAGTLLLAPFQIFVRILRAPDVISFIPDMPIVLLIDGFLLVLAYRLDALSLEAEFAISEKLSARLKRMQTKGVWQSFSTATSAVAKRKVRPLPFWGGIGPVMWQRMTTIFRSSNALFWGLGGAVLLAAGIIFFIARVKSGSLIAPFMGIGAMGYMSLIACLTLQNDIERVGFLKSLPIRSVSIVLGELLGFVILLSVIQSLFIVTLTVFFRKQAFWLFCGASMTLPLNFLLFAVDKLIFYIYPTRLAKGAPGDFQNAGKQTIFMMLKMLMLGGAILIVALAALPPALILQSPLVGVVIAGIVLLIECAVVVPLLVTAFNRFDPSVTLVS